MSNASPPNGGSRLPDAGTGERERACVTDRPVLVHYHIFKNAGCSIDFSLKASFGQRWAVYEGAHAHDIRSSGDMAQFLRANKHLLAVSSHLARPPLPWEGCLPVVFLRHPLLRANSVYEFVRRDSNQPFSQIARDRGFAGYVQWALRRERGSVVIRNYQVVHLSQASWRCEDILDAEADQGDLEEAKALLTTWGVAGIVESYALSARTLQSLYGPDLPGLEFKDVRINATSPMSSSPWEQIDQYRKLLGRALSDDFMETNALDLALYEHARLVLDRAARRASAVHHAYDEL